MTGDWRDRAACRNADLEAFFHDSDVAEASRWCHTCPVLTDCLAEALACSDIDGFRGGKTGPERRALLAEEKRRNRVPTPHELDTVPVLGVVRRRRALACIGYSLADLAGPLGVDVSTVSTHVNRQRMLRSTFDRWCRVYDELKSVPGGNVRAQRIADSLKWAPPWAWTPDTIDDPNSSPRASTLEGAVA